MLYVCLCYLSTGQEKVYMYDMDGVSMNVSINCYNMSYYKCMEMTSMLAIPKQATQVQSVVVDTPCMRLEDIYLDDQHTQ